MIRSELKRGTSVAVLEPPALTLAEAAPLYRKALRHAERTYLYAIQQGVDGPVKIGLAKNPAERIATLQQGNPKRLHGLAAWPALALEEKQLHEEFASTRLVGEWFEPTAALLDLVLALGGCFEDWK